ncbi:hypothetical protein [Streptomyces sp. HUAS TT7]|uniref:hypothetical protein n=1 Tax=Streptomyces sp. HUAS TT7 TaxID=3447507 RepID=UPI003F65FC4A
MCGILRAWVIGRWRAERRAKAARPWVSEHHRRRLVVAAHWTITTAQRAVRPDEPVRVMVADVQRRAVDDFGMTVSRDDAAAVLRERLRSLDVETDAFGTPSS